MLYAWHILAYNPVYLACCIRAMPYGAPRRPIHSRNGRIAKGETEDRREERKHATISQSFFRTLPIFQEFQNCFRASFPLSKFLIAVIDALFHTEAGARTPPLYPFPPVSILSPADMSLPHPFFALPGKAAVALFPSVFEKELSSRLVQQQCWIAFFCRIYANSASMPSQCCVLHACENRYSHGRDKHLEAPYCLSQYSPIQLHRSSIDPKAPPERALSPSPSALQLTGFSAPATLRILQAPPAPPPPPNSINSHTIQASIASPESSVTISRRNTIDCFQTADRPLCPDAVPM